jgi:hypothetical protein
MKKTGTDILCEIMQRYTLRTVKWLHYVKSSANELASAIAWFKSSWLLWGTMRSLSAHVKSPHSLEQHQENTRYGISAITVQRLRCVSRNIFPWCGACLEAEGLHYETFLS